MAKARRRGLPAKRTGRRRPRSKPRGTRETLEVALASLRAEVLLLRLKLETLEQVLAAHHAHPPPPDQGLFLRELQRVHGERATPLGTAAIPDLREALCSLFSLSAVEFDQALIRCWEEGQVELETGSPIGRPGGGHLEYRGKRYYYVRLAAPPGR